MFHQQPPNQPAPQYVVIPESLTIAKPTLFLGKPEEDAQEWIENFENIAIANGWDDNKKLQVIPVYLLQTAKRWLDEN
jgi:hypothetical protein